jgi:hypothetical protein
MMMQPHAVVDSCYWSIALTNGSYTVSIGVGDPSYLDSHHVLNANGTCVVDFYPGAIKYAVGTAQVKVSDGLLNIVPAEESENAKMCYVHISPVPTDAVNAAVADGLGLSLTADALLVHASNVASCDLTVYGIDGSTLYAAHNLALPACIPISELRGTTFIAVAKAAHGTTTLRFCK